MPVNSVTPKFNESLATVFKGLGYKNPPEWEEEQKKKKEQEEKKKHIKTKGTEHN